MKFLRIAAVLALLALQVSCQVSLIRNFDPQDCIIEGTVITLTCKVEDRNSGFGATLINGSQAIFNCPSGNSIEDNMLYLQHSHMQSAEAYCGNLISGRIVEVELNGTGSVFIAQINITTTIAMNGGYVECSELGMSGSQQIILANINALPSTHVEFPSDSTFVVDWNHKEGAQISHYSIDLTGEDCGECTNLGIVSSVTNQLSCTGWEPNGQVCNVTVTAITSACGLWELSSSQLVYLKVPEAPLLEDIMPAYSLDLKELQTVEIFLAVDSTVDPNNLPVTFQVTVGRSSQYESPKCSLSVTAENRCSSKYSKFRCKIDFIVKNCPQLFTQPEQESDYQIGFFSENSIGRSSLKAISSVTVPSYAHLMVQLSFEQQQNQEEYHFIFVSFHQIYEKVSSMIEYGSNCQALDNETTIVGFNVTTQTFRVPGITDNICFIVTINNTFQSIAIEGNFTFETTDVNQQLKEYIFGAGVSVLIVIVGITTIAFLWYIQRRRQQSKTLISFGISQSKLLSSATDQEFYKHS